MERRVSLALLAFFFRLVSASSSRLGASNLLTLRSGVFSDSLSDLASGEEVTRLSLLGEEEEPDTVGAGELAASFSSFIYTNHISLKIDLINGYMQKHWQSQI